MLKKALKYIIPSFFTSILSGIYIIVDGFFVGEKIGDFGLAAINIAWPIPGFMQALGVAVGLGCGIHLSFSKGNGNEKNRDKIIKTTFFILILSSILMLSILLFLNPLLRLLGTDDQTHQYAYDYVKVMCYGSIFQVFGQALIPLIRNCGKIKWATITLILCSVANFIGDYILIYLFDMGLVGAALASVFAQGIVTVVALVILYKEHMIKIGKPTLSWSGKILKSSLAPFILVFSSSFLIIVYNLKCKQYGGNEAIAAYTVYSYILYIVAFSATGIGDGIQPLISYHYAKKDKRTLKFLIKTGYIIATVTTVVLSVVLLCLQKQIGILFSLSAHSYQIYKEGYIYFIIGFSLLGVIRMTMSYMYAIDKSLMANILVISEPLLGPILLLVIPRLKGLSGVWLVYTLSQGILLTTSFVFLFINLRKTNEMEMITSTDTNYV